MASTTVLLLQLLLVSLAAASHHYGGSETYTYKGRNPDGSFRVDIRSRSTFRGGCGRYHYPYCRGSSCATITATGTIDRSSQWCETETLSTMNVTSDRPLSRSTHGCCWVQTRNSVFSWNLMTYMNLGTRSDTRQPNRSPDTAILPHLRVPHNCPRTYNIMAFDPDGDRVRCQYSRNNQPQGFHLDQNSCKLYYNSTTPSSTAFGFELELEDHPQRHITLIYTGGHTITVPPLSLRRRKRAATNTTYATTTAATTTTTAVTTTTAATTTTPATTTTAAPTTTTPATTTTAAPTTTTPATTTTAAPTTTTHAPTTALWWWLWTSTTTRATTTTTRATTTTTPATTTTAATTTTTPVPTTTPGYTTTMASPVSLSKLPLQFSVIVDYAAPSCEEGVYLPKFVNPTPANGARVQAEVNKEVEIRVKAQVRYGSIQNIFVSGPMNINKHNNAQNEFVIKWTPLQSDLGDHYPICFAVDAVFGSRIFQSEMRCVLVGVSTTQVKSHVICTETTMTVMVEKASFPRLHQDHLRLSDPTNTVCSLQTHSNSTHVIGVFPLNACGTQIEEDNDNLYFKNEITPFDDSRDLITRKHLLEVQFYCQYPKRGNVTLGFLAHRNNVTVWDKGFGTFTYQFEFYPDNQFQTMIDPNSYPLEYDLGSRIYMQIEATSSVNNTELFVESCKASPYDNPNYSQTYSIIENGCKVDPTVVIHPSSDDKEFQFSIEAFKFIGLHDQVYISCSLMMCEAGNPSTRCSQGCIAPQSKRRKRDAIIQSANHFVSQGPLRLRRSAESREATGTWNLNLNLVFIAGCLLAAVGMVCGVVIYKAKVSKVKYQPLPSFEH